MIFFKCVGCGAALQTGDEWAGKTARCPYCQAISPVPCPQLQPANYPKRTSRVKILARVCAYPIIVIVSWAYLFDSWFVFGVGLAVLAGIIFYFWVGTNLLMRISSPGYTKLWKAGGGDPWFDSLPPPFNMDPDEVRYQELYRERLRLEEQGIKFE